MRRFSLSFLALMLLLSLLSGAKAQKVREEAASEAAAEKETFDFKWELSNICSLVRKIGSNSGYLDSSQAQLYNEHCRNFEPLLPPKVLLEVTATSSIFPINLSRLQVLVGEPGASMEASAESVPFQLQVSNRLLEEMARKKVDEVGWVEKKDLGIPSLQKLRMKTDVVGFEYHEEQIVAIANASLRMLWGIFEPSWSEGFVVMKISLRPFIVQERDLAISATAQAQVQQIFGFSFVGDMLKGHIEDYVNNMLRDRLRDLVPVDVGESLPERCRASVPVVHISAIKISSRALSFHFAQGHRPRAERKRKFKKIAEESVV